MKTILVLILFLVPVHAQDDRYRIGAGDVLDIRIYNRPQLSREAVRVEGSGMIRMPLIETEIQAACQTEGELAKEISTRYAKYYKNLQVDVFIKEYHSRQVAIIGAVNDQSRFELQRRQPQVHPRAPGRQSTSSIPPRFHHARRKTILMLRRRSRATN